MRTNVTSSIIRHYEPIFEQFILNSKRFAISLLVIGLALFLADIILIYGLVTIIILLLSILAIVMVYSNCLTQFKIR